MLPRTALFALATALLASLPLQAIASTEAPWWVLRTIQKYLPDAEVVTTRQKGHDYAVTYQRHSHQGTALIEESGRLVEIHEFLAFSSVPPAIQKIILSQIGDGSIVSIHLEVNYGILEYIFQGRIHGKVYHMTIDQNNKVLSRKMER